MVQQSLSAETHSDLSGFERFYTLLRALVNVQNTESFYDRLEILLTLARWTGPPPTIEALARQLSKPSDTLSYTLGQLRQARWLVSGENQLLYALTPEGRILIVLLQLLAQPWTDSDTVPIAAKLSGVAESLGIQADFRRAQFDMLLAALEVQIGKIETVVEAEDTALVASRLRESERNVKLGQEALRMRQQGAVSPDDHEQAQRMHDLLSTLINLGGKLDVRYQELVTRDLLAEGGVTLGDIMEWARSAEDDEMAETILPFMRHPYLPIWSLPERAMIDGVQTLLGQITRGRRTTLPKPAPFAPVPPAADISAIKQRIYQLQTLLQTHLNENDPLPLVEWIDQDTWDEAVMHFVAALDRALTHLPEAIYLQLDKAGKLEHPNNRPVQAVTAGRLSHNNGRREE